jgi:hypothetical protein
MPSRHLAGDKHRGPSLSLQGALSAARATQMPVIPPSVKLAMQSDAKQRGLGDAHASPGPTKVGTWQVMSMQLSPWSESQSEELVQAAPIPNRFVQMPSLQSSPLTHGVEMLHDAPSGTGVTQVGPLGEVHLHSSGGVQAPPSPQPKFVPVSQMPQVFAEGPNESFETARGWNVTLKRPVGRKCATAPRPAPAYRRSPPPNGRRPPAPRAWRGESCAAGR